MKATDIFNLVKEMMEMEKKLDAESGGITNKNPSINDARDDILELNNNFISLINSSINSIIKSNVLTPMGNSYIRIIGNDVIDDLTEVQKRLNESIEKDSELDSKDLFFITLSNFATVMNKIQQEYVIAKSTDDIFMKNRKGL